jgi:hypothetical protein
MATLEAAIQGGLSGSGGSFLARLFRRAGVGPLGLMKR